MADDLAAWLTQIWDEQEESAQLSVELTERAYPSDEFDVRWKWARLTEHKTSGGGGQSFEPGAPSPTEVLARIAADRQILADWQQANGEHQSWCEEYHDFGAIEDYGRADKVRGALESLERIVRLLALPYADRPGYREEWRPE